MCVHHLQTAPTNLLLTAAGCVQVNFFHFVAEEVRIGLAELGLRSLDELIGRADLLKQRSNLKLAKTQGLDLSFIMSYAGVTGPSSVRSKQEVRSLLLCLVPLSHTPLSLP